MTQQGRHVFEFGPFRIEDGERLLRRGGTVVPLPPKAVALLMALLHRSGEFIEKGQLLAEGRADPIGRAPASPRGDGGALAAESRGAIDGAAASQRRVHRKGATAGGGLARHVR